MKKSEFIQPNSAALVLLSGGLDSVAALHWSIRKFERVEALSFRYGQPHAHAELTAAGIVCKRNSIPHDIFMIGDAVRGQKALEVPLPGMANGVSRANMPGRNLVFLSIAAAAAARRWTPETHVSLVLGCNADDAAGFPDCRHEFMGHAERAIGAGIRGLVHCLRVETPWLMMSKREIVAWAAVRPSALADILESVSCYAGTRCGTCDACTLRERSFAEAHIADGSTLPPKPFGGDPHRERP